MPQPISRYSETEVHRRFEGKYCLHLQGVRVIRKSSKQSGLLGFRLSHGRVLSHPSHFMIQQHRLYIRDLS
jgi:hypothetical protein